MQPPRDSSVQPPGDPTRARGPGEPPGLAWSVVPGPGATLVRLSGELDVATAPLLRSVLSAQIWVAQIGATQTGAAQNGTTRPPGARDLRVDLSDLTFCDLHGLATLRWARDQATAAGGRLEVLHPSAFLRWVAGACGFVDLFPVRS